MLALHTWTLDTAPLDEVLRVARHVGWDGIELRRADFARAAEAGRAADDVFALAKASGLPVACVGVELGWMWADGDARRRLLRVFDKQCARAAALGLEPGKFADRLPPGQGVVPFAEFFALLARKGYRGFMSYEAPNLAAWARPPEDVAREALEATRARLPSG